MAFKVLLKTLSGTTPQQLTTAHIPARWAIINNVTGNGTLTVGDKNLSATAYGFQLAAAAISTPIGPFSGELPFNLEDIWVSGTDTNVIRVTYVT